jgi:hypothetical protein
MKDLEARTASTAASGRKLRDVFAVKKSSEVRNPAKTKQDSNSDPRLHDMYSECKAWCASDYRDKYIRYRYFENLFLRIEKLLKVSITRPGRDMEGKYVEAMFNSLPRNFIELISLARSVSAW